MKESVARLPLELPGISSSAKASGRAPPLAVFATRLAFGLDSGLEAVEDWNRLLDVCVTERCAALGWFRQSDAIRRHAPGPVAERWRQLFRDISVRGHVQLAAAGLSGEALESADIAPITLKGLPLAERLYGDLTVRACSDVDWFIPDSQRAVAREVLKGYGWSHYDGEPPWDETLARLTAHGALHLEVHSKLLHGRLSYLPVPPPEGELVVLEGVRHRRHCGAILPAYLAAHLASHSFPPLLWLVDFATLWDSLTEPERSSSRRAASLAGLDRYLAWACRRASAVRRAAEARPRALTSRALTRIGVVGEKRVEAHPVWRHIWLAPTLRASSRAIVSWVAPPWVTGAQFRLALTIGRIAKYWRTTLPRSRAPGRIFTEAKTGYKPREKARIAEVAGETMLMVVQQVVATGGEMWIVSMGKSMLPTIAHGDRVLLGAPRRLRSGDIVLTSAGGQPLLHRVIRISGDSIITRGDACDCDDEPVARACVVARALALNDKRGTIALIPSVRFGGRALARFARSSARVAIARREQARRPRREDGPSRW